YTTNEIFEGPLLSNGFLDSKELKASALRSEIRLSDIMKLVMEIKGVNKIIEISINDCNNPDDETDKWLICVEPGKKPARCGDSAYSYYKGVLPLNMNQTIVDKYREKFKKEAIEKQENAKIGKEIQFPSGKYLNTSETTTIQNDFPNTYGINRAGLPSRSTAERKSQAKQLKAYLLFFDQILATYFAHLEKVKDVLSIDNQLKTTYFTQAVKDIKEFEELVSKYPSQNPEKLTKQLLSKLDHPIQRKNKFLDHLIARFAEKFSDYAFLMKELYGDYADQAILHSKENFLKDYQITSKQRGSAFNYSNQLNPDLWNTNNVAGIQKRIARLAGMKNFKRRNLSNSFVEIYDLLDSDNKKVYRWRIKNIENKIILSATENYSTPGKAKTELNLAIVKIIETSPETVKKAFINKVEDEDEIGNFEIQISETGKYSFDIINLDTPHSSTKRIIARQFLYYNSQEKLKDAILEIIKFMTSDFTEEGMFLLEHILLRPDVTETNEPLNYYMPICTDNCESCEPVDPYSFSITVVLPGWTYRFADPDFRDFMEELIRKEIPAHILARICWVGNPRNEVDDEENDLYNFEKAWKKFLFSKTKNRQAQNNKWLENLIEKLNKLNSIYPSGRLIDCNDEEDSLEGKIILGSTYIGNL
ncbi:MAG: hypothetical protein HOG79_02345, partial [Prolixibacteraceae bacterium]|nr:hypothetical protein [Prolixibacteraceae bacterium]